MEQLPPEATEIYGKPMETVDYGDEVDYGDYEWFKEPPTRPEVRICVFSFVSLFVPFCLMGEALIDDTIRFVASCSSTRCRAIRTATGGHRTE